MWGITQTSVLQQHHGRLKTLPSLVRNHAFSDLLRNLAINNVFEPYTFQATKYGGKLQIHRDFSKKGPRIMYLLNDFTGILLLGNCRKTVTSKLLKSQTSGLCSMACALRGV